MLFSLLDLAMIGTLTGMDEFIHLT